MFKVAVENLRRVVGQKRLERVPIKRRDIVWWRGMELVQRQ